MWTGICSSRSTCLAAYFFFFQAEDGIRDYKVTGGSDVCSSDLVAEDADDHADHERGQAAVPRQDVAPVREGAQGPGQHGTDEDRGHEIQRHWRGQSEGWLKPFLASITAE